MREGRLAAEHRNGPADEAAQHMPLHDFPGPVSVAVHRGVGDLDVLLLDPDPVLFRVLLALQPDLALAVCLVPQSFEDSDQQRVMGRAVDCPVEFPVRRHGVQVSGVSC